MKNPLNKRIPREFRQDFGKFFVIFAFLVLLISLVSGFLVATGSCADAFYKGVTRYKLEDGHLCFDRRPPESVLRALEQKAGIRVYALPRADLRLSGTRLLRIYPNREKVDLACVIAGKLPAAADEIALDRLFAENNHYEIGGLLKVGTRELKITGTVALPDYSVLFKNNGDSLFNASEFGVGVMSQEGFEKLGAGKILDNYAWLYDKPVAWGDDKANHEAAERVTTALKDVLKSYNENQADETIAAGKLLLLDKILSQMKEKLQAAGLPFDVYLKQTGEEGLLEQIRQQLAANKINLSEKLAAGKKQVELTLPDLRKALKADKATVEAAQSRVDHADSYFLGIDDFLPRYQNQAITFAINDIGGDTAMFLLFDYLVTIALAFVFAVTISNTIQAEAGVIGTLRASGFTRGELLRHYLTLPILVTLLAGLVGNAIGYSVLKHKMAALYYHSYSLATYETVWNADAFVRTTIVPIILMFIINLWVLARKLRIPVISFLRHDLSKKSRRNALPLSPKLPFLLRYRLRVFFQNVPNYLTLVFGVFLGGMVTVFSLMFPPMLEEYKQLMIDTRLADYQYILKTDDVHVSDSDAEKFALTSLKSRKEGYIEEDVSVYGVSPDSRYIRASIPAGRVLLSEAFATKYSISPGETVTLRDSYRDKVYHFTSAGTYPYQGGLAIFLPLSDYRSVFDKKPSYFTGFFSSHPLSELSESDIAKVLTVKDLTMISDQLSDSMGGFMGFMRVFGVILFLLLMYLLSKQIIEKNANSISMNKILGFGNIEIGRIYIIATSVVVVLSLLLAIPLINYTLHLFFENYLYRYMKGYMPFLVSNFSYIGMFVIGLLCYTFVALTQLLKISRISKADVLKYME